jgi:hypothetical protein
MNYLNRVWTYWKTVALEAYNKVTTYVVALIALISELPNLLDQATLDSLGLVDKTRRHVIAVLAVIGIWTRVRRYVKERLSPKVEA